MTQLPLIMALLALMICLLTPHQTYAQSLAEYETYLAEFSRSHFAVIWPKLKARVPVAASTTPHMDTLLFPRKDRYKIVKRDAEFNAKVLETHFGKISDFVAGKKRDALQSALVSSGLALQTELNELKSYSESLLLPHFTDNIAMLTTDKRVKLMPARSNLHDFRILLLGLNALLVAGLNDKATKAVFELNHIAAVDPTEYASFKGYKSSKAAVNASSLPKVKAARRALQSNPSPPPTVNWVSAGAVGPVQNQGSCGGCWSFAATAVLSSRLVVAKKGNLTVLSQQQLISCSSANGCGGGEYQQAWDYANTVGGLVTGTEYPYASGNGQSLTCIPSETVTPVVTAGPNDAYVATEPLLQSAVASGGPVAISIATPSCFHYYSSGILTSQDCPACYPGNPIDHAVTVVGYGTQDGVGYWQIQNSWGPSYGMNGYILFEAGVQPSGMCGMMTDPSYPFTVSLSTECQAANPPSFCNIIEPTMYANVNGTSDTPGMCVENPAGIYIDSQCTQTEGGYVVPTWAWVLLGIALALIVLIVFSCLYVRCIAQSKRSSSSAGATKAPSGPPSSPPPFADAPETVVVNGVPASMSGKDAYGVERV